MNLSVIDIVLNIIALCLYLVSGFYVLIIFVPRESKKFAYKIAEWYVNHINNK